MDLSLWNEEGWIEVYGMRKDGSKFMDEEGWIEVYG